LNLRPVKRPTPVSDVTYRRLLTRMDWSPRDQLAGIPSRRKSLSPTRKLALDHLQAHDKPGSRKYEVVKWLTDSAGDGSNGTGRQAVDYKARSVFDVDRLHRRADRRRDEVALHLVSHDPSSPMFRAALTPKLQTYQLAPRLASL